MDAQGIHAHWTDWAKRYGSEFRATTKTWTIKALEIDALRRAIARLHPEGGALRLLEAGAGNGVNCIELAKHFPDAQFDGFDYVAEMVDAADKVIGDLAPRVRVFQGDVLKMSETPAIGSDYDIVFTDRCLINIRDLNDQINAISDLAGRLRPGGHLLMIENSTSTYGAQNNARVKLGLEPRTPDPYNLFFDEEAIFSRLGEMGLTMESATNFASLHDLLLYVLVPSFNGGTVDYDHPVVKAVTDFYLSLPEGDQTTFGGFGQNQLYVCKKA